MTLARRVGNETQYLFSEGDIHPSDADVVRQPATGECVIPRSFELLWIILATDTPFLCLLFPQLSFSDASLRDVYLLLEPTFSSPLAGASVSNLEASLPADLSGITIEPHADSTRRAADVLDKVSAPIVPVLPSSCVGDLDVSLAVLFLQRLLIPCCCCGHSRRWGVSPSSNFWRQSENWFSAVLIILAQGSSAGGDWAESSKIKHGKCVWYWFPSLSFVFHC